MPGSSRGRRLFGAPVLLQDWDREAEEGAAQYWELFLDLLLVAGASSLADQFKENLNAYGLGEFTVFYLLLVDSWLLYTHHITSRFEDSSLAHSMVLFVYCVGFGGAIVNTGYADVQAFCWGALLQRFAILWMLGSLAACIPRARTFCFILAVIILCTMLGLLVVALWGDSVEHSTIIMTIFWMAACLEFMGEVVLNIFMDTASLIPINIEQTKERLGALELVMLGETVLSVCIIYKEMLSKGEIFGMEEEHDYDYERDMDGNVEVSEIIRSSSNKYHQPYYWALIFSFLLVFMFLLFYFHMQPAPADHAFRRSRFHGTAALLLHKVLGLAFLAVGTSIKLVVECLLSGDDKDMPLFASKLMGYGVGSALLLLFIMRYLHYGGRDGINFGGDKVLYYGRDPALDQIAMFWWWTVGVAALLPFVGVLTGVTLRMDPLILTSVHAGLLFWLCAIESYYSHLLQDGVLRQDGSVFVAMDEADERAYLVSAANEQVVSYN